MPPPRPRSEGGVWNSCSQAAGTGTGSKVSVGSEARSDALLPVVGMANSPPPGMPSRVSVSVCCCFVALISSSAVPDRKMPYCCRNSRLVENVATPQKATLLTEPPVSSTNTAAPDARLPILITSIVPEAVSSKRLTVWPLTVRVPKSSSAPPRIASRGVSLSSLNRPPARSSMPPLIEMKKMRDCDWLPPPPVVPAAAAWSNSWKESVPASPPLPALSCQVSGTNETCTVPAANWPVR